MSEHHCQPEDMQENCRCHGYHCKVCGQRWITFGQQDEHWNGRCGVVGCPCKFCEGHA